MNFSSWSDLPTRKVVKLRVVENQSVSQSNISKDSITDETGVCIIIDSGKAWKYIIAVLTFIICLE